MVGSMHEPIPQRVLLLIESITAAHPYHANELKKGVANLNNEELFKLEEYLLFCQTQGLSIDYLAQCYSTILTDVLRESIYFKQHKKYRYSSFSEVANSVYYNDEYMSLYMHGLLITLFFWPNHLKLYRFFLNTLPSNKSGTYLEVGTGHGYFFKTALERSSYNTFVGIDLSATSIRQTQLLSSNSKKVVQLHCADFLTFPCPQEHFDAIVMGELLEHVENPQEFLNKVSLIAKNNAYIFVTTCLNAPELDHIYLFSDLTQLEDLFSHCGLRIKESCIIPYLDKSLEESIEQFLTISVGYVLEKK